MDLILFTVTKLKQFVEKLKSLFSFIESNYLPGDLNKVGFGFLDIF